MPVFSQNFLDELRNKVPMSSVVRTYTKVMSKGGKLLALCPLHDEKTPSFSLSDERGVFYCFGCGEKGDIFSLVMRKQNISFAAAVKVIAGQAGVALPDTQKNDPQSRLRQEMIRHTESVAKFYSEYLWSSSEGAMARDYLKGRGFSKDTCEYFQVGLSPRSGAKTLQNWVKKGLKFECLKAAGCVGDGQRQQYDRFAGRLIFPIRSTQGEVLAFSGRTLDDKAKVAKYVNSPETALFKKKFQIYNAHRLRYGLDQLYIVEGFTDVMRIHQETQAVAVASMGTAFSAEQMLMAWKYCGMPTLWFDGDDAGRRAQKRLLMLVVKYLEPNRSLHCVNLASNQDPDAWVRENMAVNLSSVPRIPCSEALWTLLKSDRTLSTPEQWASFEEDLYSCVDTIDHAGVKKYYRRYMNQRLFDSRPVMSVKRAASLAPKKLDALQLRQKILLLLMCGYPRLLDFYDEAFEAVHFADARWASLQEKILKFYVDQDQLISWSLVKSLLLGGYANVLRDLYQKDLYVHAPFLFRPESSFDTLRVVCDDLFAKIPKK